MKALITEHLGYGELILPSLIAKGLAANDRAKVRMSVLQALLQHALHPTVEPMDLSAECRASGVDAKAVRRLIAEARASDGRITAPGLARFTETLRSDVQAMLDAVAAGDTIAGKKAAERWPAIQAGATAADDQIALDVIAALTSLAGSDSIHRLVMDLHKELNRLSAACAEETVNGAHAYGLLPDDRPMVAAFMRGVDRTRALKFNHPGLETSAARSASRLIIQNDLGTTDAHVIVVTVEGTSVIVTHTDIHRARAKFLTSLLDRFPVRWSGLDRRNAEGIGEDSGFYLTTGQYEAESSERRDAFLEAVGAALVFLIDWNKARKELRSLADRADGVRILDWAARNQIGHRAFLELGGSSLVAAAVRHAAATRIGFGERLSAALGREETVDFLKTVLRVSKEALIEGRSVRVVRDEIEADLVRRLERTDNTLLTAILRQAGLAREIAARIGQHVAGQQAGGMVSGPALAALAQRIEQKADRMVLETRNSIARLDASPTILQLANAMEATIDELEQAAFIASLLPANLDPVVLPLIANLCAAAVGGAEALASGISAAVDVPEGQHVDTEDALAAITRLADLEHTADSAERTLTARVLCGHFEIETALSVLELARALERASDGMAVAANLLHTHVMADLSI
ncbi:MAG: hypothetical protein LAP38_00095 [Acidobacteriia bacterium]|nr:hypothetical protein [Terriglobia bacterium]